MFFYICKMYRYIIWFILVYYYLGVNCSLRIFNVVYSKLRWENETVLGNLIMDILINRLYIVN